MSTETPVPPAKKSAAAAPQSAKKSAPAAANPPANPPADPPADPPAQPQPKKSTRWSAAQSAAGTPTPASEPPSAASDASISPAGPAHPPSDTSVAAGLSASAYLAVEQSPEFANLRRALRRFVFPMTVAFFLWYALYVIMSAYARGFMATKVVGNINIALVFGLLQFVTTFLIAWVYSRYADRKLDPLAAQLRARVENGGELR